MKSSISRAPITASTGLSDSAQIVRGATNLTTVGAVPYVSASGVLNQDASNFFWDATNYRLGIGKNAPARQFHLSGSSSLLYLGITIQDTSATPKTWAIANDSQPGKLGIMDGSTYRLIVGSTGSVGIGTSNTSPTGTLHVYDATASTGATTLTVKAGAGQSTTNLQEWQLNAGTVAAKVTSAGQVVGTSVTTPALTVATLPATPVAGQRAFVTDSNAVSFTAGIGAVVASGGSTAVPVVYDGTSWRIG